jgi:hypothetical protein
VVNVSNSSFIITVWALGNYYLQAAVTEGTLSQWEVVEGNWTINNPQAMNQNIYVNQDLTIRAVFNESVGVEEPHSKGSISLSPTLFEEFVKISVGDNDRIRMVEVFDITGARVFKQESSQPNFDLQSLSPGLYFFRIATIRGESAALKVVKNR